MREREGFHVLLVEDNPDERWLLAETLRGRGHTVTAAEDAESAWDAYREMIPELLVLDWGLPGMSGLELCQRVRSLGETRQSVIVVVTARDSPEDLRKVLEAGADDYVAKPVDLSLMDIRLAVAEQRVRNLKERASLLSDATHRKTTEDELASRNQELAALYRISELVLTNSHLQAAAREIVTEVAGATACPVVFLERFHPARECFTVVAAHGFSLPADEKELETRLHESLSGAAVQERRTVAVEDVRGHPRLRSEALERMDLRSMAVFPLVTSAGVWGALSLARTEIDRILPRTLRWGESLANTLTSFIERVEAEEALGTGEREALGLAADLRRANEELEAFAYSVSHDLRAPLRTMQGFAHALLRDHGDALPARGRDFVRRIIDSGRVSEKLIRDLLAYSHMSFETLGLQEVDLGQALAEARDQVAGDLEEAGAEIRVEGPLPSVRAHHATVVQVLANLLSNAVKFVEGGTSPLVSLRWEEGPEGRNVRIWVEDNGTGIPRDQQERIFRVFERLQDEAERPGTGIGLAIVRRGMERMGGRVGVESEPGEGSRFWLDFPPARPSPRRPWSHRGEGRDRT